MVKNYLYALILTVLMVASHASIAADPDAGKQKAQLCAACHGPDGNSTNPAWPSLAGQHPEYLIKQLGDFKSGARKNAQMAPMAAPLSEVDMADIAAWFHSNQTRIGAASPDLLEAGQKLYRYGNAETGVPACMRVATNRVLMDKLANDYLMVVLPYPHMILRENKMIFGAHADRLQQGMRRSFGKAIGTAARIEPNQTLITVRVKASALELAKESLKRGSAKLPTPCRIIVEKIQSPNVKDKPEMEPLE